MIQVFGAKQIGRCLAVHGCVPQTNIASGQKFVLHYGDLTIKTIVTNSKSDAHGMAFIEIDPPIPGGAVVVNGDILEFVQ